MSEEQEQYICDLEEDIKNVEAMYGALKATHSALQSDNKRLREALEKYGDHLGACYENLRMGKCNCGLEEALKETP